MYIPWPAFRLQPYIHLLDGKYFVQVFYTRRTEVEMSRKRKNLFDEMCEAGRAPSWSPQCRHTKNNDDSLVTGAAALKGPISLPPELLAVLVTKLPSRDQAVWMQTSRALFDPIGRNLWRRISLDPTSLARDRHTSSTPRTAVQTRMDSFVNIVDVLPVASRPNSIIDWIFIGDRLPQLPSLQTVTMVVTPSTPECAPLFALSDIRKTQSLKLVMYDVDTTKSAQRDRYCSIETSTLSDKLFYMPPAIKEAVLYFHTPRNDSAYTAYPSVTSNKSVSNGHGRLSALTLVYSPLARNTPAQPAPRPPVSGSPRIIYVGSTSATDTTPEIHLYRTAWESDFARALVLACIAVPVKNSITIANLEQVPVSYYGVPNSCPGSMARNVTRSKTGLMCQFPAPFGLGDAFTFASSAERTYEPILENRVERIVSLIRWWIEKFLKDDKRGKELEAIWDKVKVITLAEYLSQKGRTDEWEKAPRVADWL